MQNYCMVNVAWPECLNGGWLLIKGHFKCGIVIAFYSRERQDAYRLWIA
jgi:hypothetical protein